MTSIATTMREKSVLVVRLGDIGDIVISSPVASLLKHHKQNVKLTWVIESEYAPLLMGHPDIDRLIPWDKQRWINLFTSGKWLTLLGEIRRMRKRLRQQNYDIALDLQGLLKSSFFTWLSGARIRIGLGSKEGSYWLVTKTISRNIGEQTQIGSEYRYLLSQLGFPDSPWQMYIAPPQRSTVSISKALNFDYGNERYVVFAPFTTRREKRWPIKNWQQIALRIRGRYHLKTVIIGGQDYADIANDIAGATGAINLVGKTRLDEAVDIIRHASLLVGVATGFTHMGHAFRIPTIALFGPSCPYSFAGIETSTIIYHQRFCSPCRRNPTCNNRYDCMVEIKPDEVLSELKPLMKIAAEHTKH
ncbi:heptosyltransferase-1 [Alteromonadaceae bacterium 2753L.S.0a.02]|nr:heptosyltransferase-1 [Alteromonadaceae bacterium 2753L.S.0a.02]